MRKGKSILGLKVVSQTDAVHLGKVTDLIFDHHSDELLALLLSDKNLFGLIDAQIVPWNQVVTIGPDAVMVQSAESRMRAGDDARVKDVLNRQTALSGTRIMTSDGRALGTLADTYIDETTGKVTGYEVSGGFFSDTISGKQFMPALGNMTVGNNNVVVVPAEAAVQLESQRNHNNTHTDNGALKKTVDTMTDRVSGAYGTAKEKFSESYANVSASTTEKQKAFVVGKTAGRDVLLPAAKIPVSPTGLGGAELNSELSAPVAPTVGPTDPMIWDLDADPATAAPKAAVPPATDPWDGKPVNDEILVRKGQVITAVHADQADAAGVLHQLLIAAGAGAATNIAANSSEGLANFGNSLQNQAQNAVVGSVAGRQVMARDGSVLVAAGEVISEAAYKQAVAEGNEGTLAASASLATVAHGAEVVKEQAVHLWDTIRHKAEELAGAAHARKPEVDTRDQQERIDNALGRPVSRRILDNSDAVILDEGDIVTNASIDRARAAGMLQILLDSVYVSDVPAQPESIPSQPTHAESSDATPRIQQLPPAATIDGALAMPAAPAVRDEVILGGAANTRDASN